MKSRPSAHPSLSSLLGAAALGLFAACGQPGQTGLDYLDQQGIRLSAPLYRLSFESFPIDSVFATELPENHHGESLLVAGREGPFLASARMGFQITTQAQRDSLAHGLHLRLTALPLGLMPAGKAFLSASAQGRDSLTLLVESFAWPEGPGGKLADSLPLLHRRILTAPVPFSTLDPQYRVRDTIRVSPSAAYADTLQQDSSQAGALPNLRERLRSGDTTRKWVVYVEVSPLPGAADSGMFRFISQAAGNASTVRRYNSGLWLGRYREDSLATVGTLLVPYRSGGAFGSPATNYSVSHTGPSSRSLLYGVSRGVQFRLNRQRLLDSIQARLASMGVPLAPAPAPGQYDRRFFVPYAEMRLPLRDSLARVDGPFALDMAVYSDVDSLGDPGSSFTDTVRASLGQTLRLHVTGGGTYSSVTSDTLLILYRPHPADSTLRQIHVTWVKDAGTADTFTVVPDGRRREQALRRRTGWLQPVNLGMTPHPGHLGVEAFFSTRGVAEPRNILDSAGKPLTLAADLRRRFWRPGADSLNVRITRGLRSILNQTPVPGLAPDLLLRGVEKSAHDTTATSDPAAGWRRVVFPVFGEIDFPRAADGKLEVGLEIYLYPLEGGQ